MRMSVDTIARLKRINWFADLPDDMLAALAGKISERYLDKDEVLFNKGDVGDSLFVILDGLVKVVTNDEDGNEIVLNKVGAGEIIGEMALLDYEPRSAGVVAIEKSFTLELKREDFMGILAGHPDLGLAIIRNLTSRLRQNTTYIEQITDMSRRVATGDYSVINETQIGQTQIEKGSEQDKVNQLMVEFVAMVRGVREREDNLRKQVQKLTLQIDEERRKQDFEEITGTEFYADLKKRAQELRAQRKDKE
jgi:CRP-like cAMP-binding protein